MAGKWNDLLAAARAIVDGEDFTKKKEYGKPYVDLLYAVLALESEGDTQGRAGNMIDESHCDPFLRHPATSAEKDQVFQAGWELYATYIERGLCRQDGDKRGEASAEIAQVLKFDQFMRTFDALADERISGVWEILKKNA